MIDVCGKYYLLTAHKLLILLHFSKSYNFTPTIFP
jgi:hypothetical protein